MNSRITRDHNRTIFMFQNEPGLRFQVFEYVLWPCNCYTVLAKGYANSSLNIFERTILRLCAVIRCDIHKLAQLMQITEAQVRLFMDRLEQQGFLDSKLSLTEAGKAFLTESENTDSMQDFQIRIFQDVQSGCLFSYFAMDMDFRFFESHFKNESDEEPSTAHIQVLEEDSDRKKNLRAYWIPHSKNSSVRVPDSKEVAQVLQDFRRRRSNFGALNESWRSLPQISYSPMSFTINSIPQQIYLCAPLVILEDSSDIFAMEPFGCGFSQILQNNLKNPSNDLEKICEKLSENTKITRHNARKEGKNRNVQIGKLYPHLKIQKVPKKRELSSYGIQTFCSETAQFLSQCYTNLEWAFYYLLIKEQDILSYTQLLAGNSQANNAKLFMNAAQDAGFQTDKVERFFQIPPAKFKSVMETPEMRCAACLALYACTQKDIPELRNLARLFPTCFHFMLNLKTYRDKFRHDGTLEKLPKENELRELNNQTNGIIQLLLPALENFAASTAAEKDAVSKVEEEAGMEPQSETFRDERNTAKCNLIDYFGYGKFNKFPSSLHESLLTLEIMHCRMEGNDERDPDLMGESINQMYSSLQNAFYIQNQKRPKENFENVKIRSMIRANVKSVGLNIDFEEFKRISVTKFQEAVKESKSFSLGTEILHFLSQPPAEYQWMEQKDIDVLREILRRRGHGTPDIQDMSLNSLNELKDRVLQIIKQLQISSNF